MRLLPLENPSEKKRVHWREAENRRWFVRSIRKLKAAVTINRAELSATAEDTSDTFLDAEGLG
jgi:hypothetical protein